MRVRRLPTVIFGEVLQELRLGQALTQDKLAEAADTERSHISAIERGEKAPSLATILILAGALRVPAALLMGMVEERVKARM